MLRVVITGQGTINSLGFDVASTIEAMKRGQSGISLMEFPNIDRLNVKIGGQIKGFDPKLYFENQKITFYDRFTQFALIAAKEAILQSGLVFEGELSQYSGVVFGTAGGGLQTQDENYRAVYEDGKNRVHPFVVPRLMNNAAVSHVSMSNNLKGPSFTVSTACASSNHAMGQAFHLVRSGAAKVMIAGGSESMLCFGGIKAWEGLRVLRSLTSWRSPHEANGFELVDISERHELWASGNASWLDTDDALARHSALHGRPLGQHGQ